MTTIAWWKPRMVSWAGPSATRTRLADVERLTAGWLGAAAVLVFARFRVLELAEKALADGTRLVPWLPLAVYQDLLVIAVLALGGELLVRSARRPATRWLARASVWAACLATAWYAVVSAEIYSLLNTPLTYRLIAMSDNLRGIRSSMDAALTTERITLVVAAPLAAATVAALIVVAAPRCVNRVRDAMSRPWGRACCAIYAVAAVLVTRLAGMDAVFVANPHWTLLASLADRSDPFIRGEFKESDLDDFRPAGRRAAASPSTWHGRAGNSNVILVVMESVGAAPLGHYGSPHNTTPELSRLAEHGLTFDRVYASQPYTSNAIAGLFCSIYPWHGWRSIPRRAPELRVTGLADVLKQHDYRTGIIHTGNMKFDNEKRFLLYHGFDEVHDVVSIESLVPRELTRAGRPEQTPGVHDHLPDAWLTPAALRWIDADRSRPFLLCLWTIQTHHPYFAEPSAEPFVADDPELNRYLNAIRVTDRVLGELARELESRRLAESTLIVVIGDHGEAFGEHAHRGHSKTLYEEELRIPLVMISPRLTDRPQRLDVLGQQIDVAPTLLDLLGHDAPAEWQGQSLFATNRPGRVYLYTAFYHYLFGVVEDDRKYVYNVTTGRRRLYDLARDPGERVDLADSASERERQAHLHRRLAAWVHFQNAYLTQFVPPR